MDATPPYVEGRSDLRVPADVYVVGDSIAAGARFELWRRHPDWVVDARPGRPVERLPRLVDRIVGANPSPRVVVLALGTNASAGWDRSDYAAAVDAFPPSTWVHLVTPYRDPRLWGRDRRWDQWAEHTGVHAAWMREVADSRPHVAVIRWRRMVQHRPLLLHDGTHPNRRGKRRWADLVAGTVAGVTRTDPAVGVGARPHGCIMSSESIRI